MLETYDTNLDGFMATLAGVVVRDIRNVILPCLRQEESNAMISFEHHKKISKELTEIRTRLVSARNDLEKIRHTVAEAIDGKAYREILNGAKKRSDSDINVDSIMSSFADWMSGINDGTDGMLKAIDIAQSDEKEGVACMAEFYEVFHDSVKFWEAAIDVYMCDYIFEHVQMKYKTKVCRTIVKMLPDVLQEGRKFLTRLDREKFNFGKNREYIRAKAEEVVQAAANRYDIYRRVKGLIEDKGIAAAFDEWKMSYEYSKQLAQRDA